MAAIFAGAIRAVAPDLALLDHMRIGGGTLEAGGKNFDISRGRIRVAGGGKGAAPMAQALEKLLGSHIAEGSITVKYDHGLPLERIELIEAAHPVPDANCLRGAKGSLEMAARSGRDDLLICLLTGGASALLTSPAHGLGLDELQETTRLLLASGATIDELNVIRKHLSNIGGGQLAAKAAGQVLAIVVSDVIGDDLGTIASGPTVPDKSTFADCLAIVEKFNLAQKLPSKTMEIFRAGLAGGIAETPKPGMELFDRVSNLIVASNGQALAAAADTARELGLRPHVISEPMRGEARDAASAFVKTARRLQATLAPGDKPLCLLAGGETTVTLKGDGLGGRNQEMALQASLELENDGSCHALYAGTDGTDGPTDAAGGFACADTRAKIGTLAQARQFLENNDSYHALKKAGDLFVTGPTRTNVMDIAAMIIEPKR